MVSHLGSEVAERWKAEFMREVRAVERVGVDFMVEEV